MKKVIGGKCPHCGSDDAFYTKAIEKLTRLYDFANCQAVDATHEHLRGGKRTFCDNCDKEIKVPGFEYR